jgi:filamentous hemagglutinin family protein
MVFHQTLLRTTSLATLGFLSIAIVAVPQDASALPSNGQVIGGQATISQTSPSQLTINQTSGTAAINWESFSIGKSETTTFHQPSSSSVAINRVTGIDPSVIEGHLNSNGEVVLVNPNGMVFTKDATVNVGGLVASTSGISKANAIAGKLVFDQGSAPCAQISNAGVITAAQGGLVALVSPQVVNRGVITARLGPVALASGDKWALDLYGDNLVKFAVGDTVQGSVTNSGVINASSTISAQTPKLVQITANAAADVVSNVINMSGIINADGAQMHDGSVYLFASGGDIAVSGKINALNSSVTIKDAGGNIGVSGDVNGQNGYLTIAASGNVGISGNLGDSGMLVKGDNIDISGTLNSNSRGGGTIDVAGIDNVLLNGAKLSVGGEVNAGTIIVTGENIALKNAKVDGTTGGHSGTVDIGNKDTQDISIDAGSVINVEGGHGGNVNIYSAGKFDFAGKINAEGKTGKGGTVVTSANSFDIDGGTVNVAGGPNSTAGKWIINVVQ